jgi:hypothetical protein
MIPSVQFHSKSIAKPEEGFFVVKEDAVRIEPGLFAVSDGAGGTGVCAERWANYLLENLPLSPIQDFQGFNQWQNEIWEKYFEDTEYELRTSVPAALPKFQNEGSSATLAVAWVGEQTKLLAFGDAVCLFFSGDTMMLKSSNIRLSDFLESPYLLNCREEPIPDGFWGDTVRPQNGDMLILASDAIGYHLLGLYALLHSAEPALMDEVEKVLESPFRQATLLENQKHLLAKKEVTSWPSILLDFWNVLEKEDDFRDYTNTHLKENTLALDDYSAVVLRFME